MSHDSSGGSSIARRRGMRSAPRPQMVRTNSITGASPALSAVHVRIAERFCPSQVNLPLSFQISDLSSIENFQYDFSLEEEVLRRGEARKRATMVQATRRASQPKEAVTMNGIGAPAPLQAMLMSNEILQPTQSTIPTRSSSEPPQNPPPSMLSLRDFESQNTDPFEMAELKTIDVMAELSSVLQPNPMVNPDNQVPQTTPPSTATAVLSTAGNATAEQRSHPSASPRRSSSPAVGLPATGPPTAAPRSHVSSQSSSSAAHVETISAMPVRPTPTPRVSRPRTDGSQSTPSQPPPSTDQPKPANSVAPRAPATRTSSTGPARPPLPSPAALASATHSSAAPTSAAVEPPPPSYSSVHGSAATAAIPPTADNFPPPYPVQAPREPKPRREAPPPPYTILASQAEVRSVRTSDYVLEDIYPRLSRKEKKVVDKLAPMGFPRARLARTVQRAGLDEAKVLEFAMLVSRLTEPPHNYPGDSCETALVNNENDEEKAIQSLKIVFELKEMGFGEAVIHNALKETKNKRDEAVEYIITHS